MCKVEVKVYILSTCFVANIKEQVLTIKFEANI
jgi:hypothetical protein